MRCVDFVSIFEKKTCEDFLKTVCPDIYVKAGDYSFESLNEKEKKELLKNKTEIRFVPFVENISSTIIINKLKE